MSPVGPGFLPGRRHARFLHMNMVFISEGE
ncbi:hypothetical protein SAM23877_0382 [Streptomyces ambofaciens ATCC 23877]|uniref:Uncharacterized protein n=1 Tax=Streptomyces ambofaciens (strain ATCC 23877 / 3486 / DSM 40053 / JCM 4204 / NBRC 12836 / NRRL B-2516) TaxID=278992 RepID=A0A0K2AKI5_STRA7|nr:hypothetical protein SAM23877_0382 [Streptomyces ambofaciens ATCC 23877]